MTTRSVTYGDIYRLLAQLDFVDVSSECPWKAYRHDATDTLILLARCEPESPARPADLVSVRRQVVDNGLVNQHDFERMLS
jgi:hypothetical protein